MIKHTSKNNQKCPFLPTGQQGKESTILRSSLRNDNKGKQGYTAEEANLPETDANASQCLEPANISPYDIRQSDSSSWDWNAETDWEEALVDYQDWETSQD